MFFKISQMLCVVKFWRQYMIMEFWLLCDFSRSVNFSVDLFHPLKEL